MQHLIDLHLHLDGSLPVATVKKLMARHQLKPLSPTALAARLSVSPHCQNLDEYLEKFAFPLTLMQTALDLKTCVYDLLRELRLQGLIYVEIRFAPQLHTQRGLSQAEVVEAAVAGLNQFIDWQKNQHDLVPELHVGLILCAMRFTNNLAENLATVAVAQQFYGSGVVGIDLAGPELNHPNRDYAEIFTRARAAGIPYTIHAGEGYGIASIKQAIALGATRIGHGIHCVESANYVQELVKRQITLECCATSNLNTHIFRSLADYPIRSLLRSGVHATLNSDNMTVSATNLPLEYQRLHEQVGLTTAEALQLRLNAVQAAFTSVNEKARLRQLIMSETMNTPLTVSD